MRIKRYHHVFHCATDSLYNHDKGGIHTTLVGWYPMPSRGGLKPMEVYRWRNQRWWNTVHRCNWRFVNTYDKDNFIFTNMNYMKKRVCNLYTL